MSLYNNQTQGEKKLFSMFQTNHSFIISGMNLHEHP